MIAFGCANIRGYNEKGKQIFDLELCNLSEPIQYFKINSSEDLFVIGQFTFNHYIVESKNFNSKSSVLKSKNFYFYLDNKQVI